MDQLDLLTLVNSHRPSCPLELTSELLPEMNKVLDAAKSAKCEIPKYTEYILLCCSKKNNLEKEIERELLMKLNQKYLQSREFKCFSYLMCEAGLLLGFSPRRKDASLPEMYINLLRRLNGVCHVEQVHLVDSSEEGCVSCFGPNSFTESVQKQLQTWNKSLLIENAKKFSYTTCKENEKNTLHSLKFIGEEVVETNIEIRTWNSVNVKTENNVKKDDEIRAILEEAVSRIRNGMDYDLKTVDYFLTASQDFDDFGLHILRSHKYTSGSMVPYGDMFLFGFRPAQAKRHEMFVNLNRAKNKLEACFHKPELDEEAMQTKEKRLELITVGNDFGSIYDLCPTVDLSLLMDPKKTFYGYGNQTNMDQKMTHYFRFSAKASKFTQPVAAIKRASLLIKKTIRQSLVINSRPGNAELNVYLEDLVKRFEQTKDFECDFFWIPNGIDQQRANERLSEYPYARNMMADLFYESCESVATKTGVLYGFLPQKRDQMEMKMNVLRSCVSTQQLERSPIMDMNLLLMTEVQSPIVTVSASNPTIEQLKKVFLANTMTHQRLVDGTITTFGAFCKHSRDTSIHMIHVGTDETLYKENPTELDLIQYWKNNYFQLLCNQTGKSLILNECFDQSLRDILSSLKDNTPLPPLKCEVFLTKVEKNLLTKYEKLNANKYFLKRFHKNVGQYTMIMTQHYVIFGGRDSSVDNSLMDDDGNFRHESMLNIYRAYLSDGYLIHDEDLDYLAQTNPTVTISSQNMHFERAFKPNDIDDKWRKILSDTTLTKYGYALMLQNSAYVHKFFFAHDDFKPNTDYGMKINQLNEYVSELSGKRLLARTRQKHILMAALNNIRDRQYFNLLGRSFVYIKCIDDLIARKKTIKENAIFQRLSQMLYYKYFCMAADENAVLIQFFPEKGSFNHTEACMNLFRQQFNVKSVLTYDANLDQEASSVTESSATSILIKTQDNDIARAYAVVMRTEKAALENLDSKIFGYSCTKIENDFVHRIILAKSLIKEKQHISKPEILQKLNSKYRSGRPLTYGSDEKSKNITKEMVIDAIKAIQSYKRFEIPGTPLYIKMKNSKSLEDAFAKNESALEIFKRNAYKKVLWEESNDGCLLFFTPINKDTIVNDVVNAYRSCSSKDLQFVREDDDLSMIASFFADMLRRSKKLHTLDKLKAFSVPAGDNPIVKRKVTSEAYLRTVLGTIDQVFEKDRDRINGYFHSFGVGMMLNNKETHFTTVFLTDDMFGELHELDLFEYVNWIRENRYCDPLLICPEEMERAKVVAEQYKAGRAHGHANFLVVSKNKHKAFWRKLYDSDYVKSFIFKKNYTHVGVREEESFIIFCFKILNEVSLSKTIYDKLNMERGNADLPDVQKSADLVDKCKNSKSYPYLRFHTCEAASKNEAVAMLLDDEIDLILQPDLKTYGYYCQQTEKGWLLISTFSTVAPQNELLVKIMNRLRQSTDMECMEDILPSYKLNTVCEGWLKKSAENLEDHHDALLTFHSPTSFSVTQAITEFVKDYPAEAMKTVLRQDLNFIGYGYKHEKSYIKWAFGFSQLCSK